jgi:hypothetical protein
LTGQGTGRQHARRNLDDEGAAPSTTTFRDAEVCNLDPHAFSSQQPEFSSELEKLHLTIPDTWVLLGFLDTDNPQVKLVDKVRHMFDAADPEFVLGREATELLEHGIDFLQLSAQCAFAACWCDTFRVASPEYMKMAWDVLARWLVEDTNHAAWHAVVDWWPEGPLGWIRVVADALCRIMNCPAHEGDEASDRVAEKLTNLSQGYLKNAPPMLTPVCSAADALNAVRSVLSRSPAIQQPWLDLDEATLKLATVINTVPIVAAVLSALYGDTPVPSDAYALTCCDATAFKAVVTYMHHVKVTPLRPADTAEQPPDVVRPAAAAAAVRIHYTSGPPPVPTQPTPVVSTPASSPAVSSSQEPGTSSQPLPPPADEFLPWIHFILPQEAGNRHGSRAYVAAVTALASNQSHVVTTMQTVGACSGEREGVSQALEVFLDALSSRGLCCTVHPALHMVWMATSLPERICSMLSIAAQCMAVLHTLAHVETTLYSTTDKWEGWVLWLMGDSTEELNELVGLKNFWRMDQQSEEQPFVDVAEDACVKYLAALTAKMQKCASYIPWHRHIANHLASELLEVLDAGPAVGPVHPARATVQGHGELADAIAHLEIWLLKVSNIIIEDKPQEARPVQPEALVTDEEEEEEDAYMGTPDDDPHFGWE